MDDASVMWLAGPATAFEHRHIASRHRLRMRMRMQRVVVRTGQHLVSPFGQHPLRGRAAVGADQTQRHTVAVPAAAGVVVDQIEPQPHGVAACQFGKYSHVSSHIRDELIASGVVWRVAGIADGVHRVPSLMRFERQPGSG